MKNKNFLRNNKGQAVFETLLFIPVLFYLVIVMIKVGNAINASINQQKATRGYTFYLLKGNSLGQRKADLDFLANNGSVNEVGSFIIGWKKNPEEEPYYGSFFKLPTFIGSSTDSENCLLKSSEQGKDKKTSCIKVFTIFGVCAETYGFTPGKGFHRTDYPNSPVGYLKSCSFK